MRYLVTYVVGAASLRACIVDWPVLTTIEVSLKLQAHLRKNQRDPELALHSWDELPDATDHPSAADRKFTYLLAYALTTSGGPERIFTKILSFPSPLWTNDDLKAAEHFLLTTHSSGFTGAHIQTCKPIKK